MQNKLVAIVIVVVLLITSLACFIDNEDFLMIEDAHQNTEQMERDGQIP